MQGLQFFGTIKTTVECNGKLIGTVGPNAEDEVTEVTDLNGNKPPLNCKVTELGPCSGNLLALVTPENLPWKTELLEPAPGEIVDHFKDGGKGKPAFSVECTLSDMSKATELCEGTVLTDALVNETGGIVGGSVLNSLSEKCNKAGGESHVNAKGTTKLALSTAALTVS
jgi:hypothetical protein